MPTHHGQQERLITLDDALLAKHPLPAIDSAHGKEERGRVLVVGGSTRVPGAVMLAGLAALRSGAGKLQLATVRPAAMPLAIAVPEALVAPLPVRRDGEIAATGSAAVLRGLLASADGVLVGPGIMSERVSTALLRALLPHISEHAVVILDGPAAVGLHATPTLLHALDGRAVVTPHAGEAASMLGIDKRDVEDDPAATALRASRLLRAVVALKGAETYVAEPSGALHHFCGGSVGLGTSGSGDVLAGVVAGLAARGASARDAALWGVWAHGRAGERLSRRIALVGFLARELLDELPALVGQPAGARAAQR